MKVSTIIACLNRLPGKDYDITLEQLKDEIEGFILDEACELFQGLVDRLLESLLDSHIRRYKMVIEGLTVTVEVTSGTRDLRYLREIPIPKSEALGDSPICIVNMDPDGRKIVFEFTNSEELLSTISR